MSSPTLYLGSKITVNPTGLIMDLSGANILINKSVSDLDIANSLYAVNKQYVDIKLSDQYDRILGTTTSDLDSFKEVVDAFKAADLSLNSAITALGSAASSNVAGEMVRATSVEAVLRSDLTSEASIARAAESVLTANLSTELSVARSTEVVLNNRINALCEYFFKNASQF